MKLSYFDLLSPEPIYIPNIGGIISPTLKSISSIGINTYQYYLTVLLMAPFHSLTANTDSISLLQAILNFFIHEDVVYSPKHNAFFVQKNEKVIGVITEETYAKACDAICQRNCIKPNRDEDVSKVKSKKAAEILKKLQKGRAEKTKNTKADKNMELGNIISAVANKSQSLSILNIWDLTVYQVWDCFLRLSNNNIYAIQSMSVAAWGDKEHSFDAAAWFHRIDHN